MPVTTELFRTNSRNESMGVGDSVRESVELFSAGTRAAFALVSLAAVVAASRLVPEVGAEVTPGVDEAVADGVEFVIPGTVTWDASENAWLAGEYIDEAGEKVFVVTDKE